MGDLRRSLKGRAYTSQLRLSGRILSARLNRQDRQERKDIAKDLLRIAYKDFFFALFAFFAVQTGGRGARVRYLAYCGLSGSDSGQWALESTPSSRERS